MTLWADTYGILISACMCACVVVKKYCINCYVYRFLSAYTITSSETLAKSSYDKHTHARWLKNAKNKRNFHKI